MGDPNNSARYGQNNSAGGRNSQLHGKRPSRMSRDLDAPWQHQLRDIPKREANVTVADGESEEAILKVEDGIRATTDITISSAMQADNDAARNQRTEA